MSDPAINPAAPDNLPYFIPGPDGSDPMFNHMIILVVVATLIIGNIYLRLHSVPERMAHSTNHFQLQAIAILTLLALFTHNQLFWVGALLLAVVRLPNYSLPLNTMARAASHYLGEKPDPALQPDEPPQPEREPESGKTVAHDQAVPPEGKA